MKIMKKAWTIIKVIIQFFLDYWHWFKKHKYEVISGLIVVYFAFLLARLGEQWALDRNTKQKLHFVVLETIYNKEATKKILDAYVEPNDPNVIRFAFERLSSISAVSALQDTNILKFLPPTIFSILRNYVDDISELNGILEMHLAVVQSQQYKRTQQEKASRQKVRDKAAFIYGTTCILREQLDEYFDRELYNSEELKKMRDDAVFLKKKALKGEFPPYKKD